MKIGVIGGGQLGRMIALAGIPLGHQFSFFDPSPEAPAKEVGSLTIGAFDDSAALLKFAQTVDIVTYEFENVPALALQELTEQASHGGAPLFPSQRALLISQDRIAEKEFFASLQLATPRFFSINSEEDLLRGLKELSGKGVLKTTRLGYDGKGQCVINSMESAQSAYNMLSKDSQNNAAVALVLEEFITFNRELSIVAARDSNGSIVFYPLVQNTHREGILRVTEAPAPGVSDHITRTAQTMAESIMNALSYTGVFTLELFERDGELLINEMAPRVHNSGHWSIEGAVTSQFENHVRAIAGMPLGSTQPRGRSLMLNLIGTTPHAQDVLIHPGAHLHHYGKTNRPGRKVGHITLVENESTDFASATAALRLLLT
jgi:5-(carboxyamino)imidazole ribonucleotide synthase